MRLRRMHSLTTCIFFITFMLLSGIFLELSRICGEKYRKTLILLAF